MQSGKKIQIIESIKNMPDQEADILEVFVAGFRAGKMTTMAELGYEQLRNPTMQTLQLQRQEVTMNENSILEQLKREADIIGG